MPHRNRRSHLAALALVALAPVLPFTETAARADDLGESVDRFRQRVAWSSGSGGLILEPRPEYLYLVGSSEELAWHRPGDARSAALATPAVVYEVEPVASLVGQKCYVEDLCLPSCREALCPPPLPVGWRDSGLSPEGDLRWSLAEGTATLQSRSSDAYFLLIDGTGGASTLAPGATARLEMPVEVHRLSCLGTFSPQFRSVADSRGGCSLVPCSEEPLAEGLCTTEGE